MAGTSNNSLKAVEERTSLLNQLDAQIKFDTQIEDSQSWLQTFVDKVWRGDEKSLEALKELKGRSTEIQSQTNPVQIEAANTELRRKLLADNKEQSFNNEVVRYGSGFIKSVPLFIPGTGGLVGTIAVNALDQARPHDSVNLQIVDATLGGVKGLAMKETLNAVGSFGLSTGQFTAFKGVAMGTALRAFDVGLDRRSYLDDSGNYSLMTGGKRLADATLDPRVAAIDLIAYGVSSKLIGTANSFTAHNLVLRSPLIQNFLTGSTFGLTYGMIGEAARQKSANESLNFYKIAGRGLLQASVDGLAAVPGGLILNHQMLPDTTSKITVREATAEDLPGMRKVARETLPLFTRNIDGDYAVVAEAEGKGIVGHLVLNTDTHKVQSMAVLPQYRRIAPKLEIMMMNEMQIVGGEWHANARESTSYPIMKLFEQRGRLQITEDKPMLSVFGERFHALKFMPPARTSAPKATALLPLLPAPAPAPQR